MARGEEDARNLALLRTPLGEEWSGRARYAAAVHFYNRGEMTPEMLEIYRICSRLDAEDPLAIMRRQGIGADWIARVEGG